MSPLNLLLVFLAVSCEAFTAPVGMASAVSRSVVTTGSPVMLFGGKKAAPKKAAKKVVKKPVSTSSVRGTRPKVVGGGGATKKNGLIRGTEKFFSKENWAVQAVDLLTKLPSSKGIRK